MTPARPDLALVLGGAWCIWDDLRRLEKMLGEPWPGWICAVNDVGIVWERRLDHWASCHPRELSRWERARLRRLPKEWTTWSHRMPKLVDRISGQSDLGSSGLFAGRTIRYEVGALRVVWVGTPLTPEPHFRESRVHREGEPWLKWRRHWEVWQNNAEEIREWGRSMSGDMEVRGDEGPERVGTMHLIGAPTREWFG